MRFSISNSVRATVAVLLTVAIVAGTVVEISSLERSTANSGYGRTLVAQTLLTAMLDRETGLRGYLASGDESFLAPYRSGSGNFQAALRTARRNVREVPEAAIALAEQIRLAQMWQLDAQRTITWVHRAGLRGTLLADALARKRLMDDFRAANADYLGTMNRRRISDLSHATHLSTWIVAVLALLLALVGLLLVRTGARREEHRRAVIAGAEREREERERTYVQAQRQFAEIVQVSETEAEAQALIKRRIEMSIAGSSVEVLNRNNSANRLEAATALESEDPLALALSGAKPRSCLAIRLGRTHREAREAGALASCELCGKLGTGATCEPLLVGGQVIGSLLISHAGDLSEQEQRVIAETVGYAAPVLANLRNLAIAERRAHTDSLTGLPNRRALELTFKLMLAQCGRMAAPLSAMLIDLDHFKQVNDSYGHNCGDEMLAAVGAALTRSVRSSDFVARVGGEEFVVLLPATDLVGAQTVASNIAVTLAAAKVAKVGHPVTASFGIAAFPQHGVDAETLLRSADRALYQAKQDGRDCVRVASGGLADRENGSWGKTELAALEEVHS